MEAIQKQEYRVRDLPTRSITLSSTRAQVVRDIKDVVLKPGVNHISIIGFTPTLDEHSIRVEGTGSAVISDISVELLKNQELFEEIYPEYDDENLESATDEDEPEHTFQEFSDDENPSRAKQDLKELRKKIQDLEDETKRAAEVVSSAETRLKMLDEYARKYEPVSVSGVGDILQTYQDQRDKIFQDHMEGTRRQRELKDQLCSLQKTERSLAIQVRDERNKALRVWRKERQAKVRERDLKIRRHENKHAEKMRVREDKKKFWARSCFTVRVTLDATQYTPISSRRSSVSSVTDLVKPTIRKEDSSSDTGAANMLCDLSISYVTAAAFWSASYDLQLSTTSNTGTLFFDAKLTNNTSESWTDCKIILSTSQAFLAGLQDAIPELVPWRVKLSSKSDASFGDITSSIQEAREQRKWKGKLDAGFQGIPGADLVGLNPFAPSMPAGSPAHGGLFGGNKVQRTLLDATPNKAPPPPPQMAVGGLFGNAAQKDAPPPPQKAVGGLFGNAAQKDAPPPPPQSAVGGLFGIAAASDRSRDGGESLSAAGAASLPEPELSFPESTMEESGLTTTYELPGTKSLVPSSTASKQRVAQISFKDIAFSHTVVAKYRPGAFLKAKLQNASRMSFLKGPVGLTLDGAFIGRATLPQCSSGDSLTMSLGIDPSIKVVYPKPEVKRGTSGLFAKEDTTAYTRSITISNTRVSSSAGGKARLLVLDQVPVSEDEKLRVVLVQPRGLFEGGAGVSTGVQDGDAKDGKDWGKAVATLKKGGEINWVVELNAGKSVKLGLEYDVSVPLGCHVVQANQAEGV